MSTPKTFVPRAEEVYAYQWDGKRTGQVVDCIEDRNGLRPVPAGLEVLGHTAAGLVCHDRVRPIKKGDWVIVDAQDSTNVNVISNDVFEALFEPQ